MNVIPDRPACVCVYICTYICLCVFDSSIYNWCVTRERACVYHNVPEGGVQRRSTSRDVVRDPSVLLFLIFPLPFLLPSVLPSSSPLPRSSSSSSPRLRYVFFIIGSVHRQVRARWPRCGVAWKSESRVSLFEKHIHSPSSFSSFETKGEKSRNLITISSRSRFFLFFFF